MDQIIQTLWTLFIGDALASPAHWYYSRASLRQDHGVIRDFVKPHLHMKGSIMSLSSTSGGGRGRDDGNIIGDVINHGKRKADYHYHCTLEKGENTLEAMLARLLVRHLTDHELQFDASCYLEDFDEFMTTPGTHNDAYASTYLRQFFANRVRGLPLDECADNDRHNTDAIDALTCLAPLVLACHMRSCAEAERHELIERALRATRDSDTLPLYGNVFGDMLANLLAERNADPAAALRREALLAARKVGFALERAACAGDDPMTACYIGPAFNAMLIFVHKYADDVEKALLASVNAGGENVARTSALGALFGAAYGNQQMSKKRKQWQQNLYYHDEIRKEIDAFVKMQSKL